MRIDIVIDIRTIEAEIDVPSGGNVVVQVVGIKGNDSGGGGITCDNLADCQTIIDINDVLIDHENRIDAAEAEILSIDSDIYDLQNDVSDVASDLVQEVIDRGNADTTLQGNINTVSSGLSTEITNRTNADTSLQTNITAEATERATADTALQTNINTEATARANTDTALQNSITSTASSLSSEIFDRTTADNTLQTNIDAKMTGNSPITGATKTKITYDSKGLVTSGADATTADIADSLNKRYITDAKQTVLGNTSGTNTGDETTATIKTKLSITTLSGANTGDQDLSGYQQTSGKNAANGYAGYLGGANNANLLATTTLTWAFTTSAPTGATAQYSWNKIGNVCFFEIRGDATGAGNGVTGLSFVLPSDMPTPQGFTDWGNGEMGITVFGASSINNTAQIASRVWLEKTSGGVVQFNSVWATGNTIKFYFSGHYFV